MDIHDIILASRAEQSYSTRARWALRAIRKYLRLGLAPSWRYKILHAHARAIFSTALKAAVISIYTIEASELEISLQTQERGLFGGHKGPYLETRTHALSGYCVFSVR